MDSQQSTITLTTQHKAVCSSPTVRSFSSVSRCFNTADLTSTTWWSADKQGRVRWNELPSMLTALALSSQRLVKSVAQTHMASSQTSPLYTSLGRSLLWISAWLRSPITKAGKAGTMYYSLLMWFSIHNSSLPQDRNKAAKSSASKTLEVNGPIDLS